MPVYIPAIHKSPFLGRKSLSYQVKAGFSGRKTDKLGRTICYDNGKRVSCGGSGQGTGKASGKKETKPKEKKPKASKKEIAYEAKANLVKVEELYTKLYEAVKDEGEAKPLGELGDNVYGFFSSKIEDSPGLSDEQRKRYAESLRRVCGRIPEVAHARIRKGVRSAAFYPNTQKLTEGVWNKMMDFIPNIDPNDQEQATVIARHKADWLKKPVAGVYYRGDKTLNLDGGDPLGDAGMDKITPGLPQSHVYAHEIGHGIDGPDFELSGSADWQEAFEGEINVKGSPLTAYARIKPSEGFAEFSRLLYGGGIDLQEVEQKFPKCSAFMKVRELWPV